MKTTPSLPLAPDPHPSAGMNHPRMLTVEPRFCGYCGIFLFYRTQAPTRVACHRCGVVWRRDAAGRWLDMSRAAG